MALLVGARGTTTPELSGVTWRKSTRSGPPANSVEVAMLTEEVAVREKGPGAGLRPRPGPPSSAYRLGA
ncbi:DUF397 domain-containing protein [Micromonospora sp. NBC_01405]|uniref:DUF397 domain-containing protein n=1 Tax=Micromonospora sp. NBC_01405 TaxID=2903589 RepID=UPI0032454BB8